MISRERIEQVRLMREVVNKAFRHEGNASATGRAINDLLTAIDEREELLATLSRTLYEWNTFAQLQKLHDAIKEFLHGGRFEVK